MDEQQIDDPGATPQAAQDVPSPPAFTGHTAVDEVLGSLDALTTLPVADHVAVFDRAHEGLRRALSDAGRDQPTEA